MVKGLLLTSAWDLAVRRVEDDPYRMLPNFQVVRPYEYPPLTLLRLLGVQVYTTRNPGTLRRPSGPFQQADPTLPLSMRSAGKGRAALDSR